jgi:hypothetical protein
VTEWIRTTWTRQVHSFRELICENSIAEEHQYSNPQTFNITEQDQVDYLLWWSKTARKNHLVINLKNAGNLLIDPDTGNATSYQLDLVKAFDYNVLEQCVSYGPRQSCYGAEPSRTSTTNVTSTIRSSPWASLKSSSNTKQTSPNVRH